MNSHHKILGKENFAHGNRSTKKYQYTKGFNVKQNHNHEDPYERIAYLEEQLEIQKDKRKSIEETTIREQTNVLEHINLLERKFVEVCQEKEQLQREVQRLNSISEIEELKKTRGIGKGLVKMMEKVSGREGSLKEAWRWVKEVVREHQAIRKTALKWKQAYDKNQNQLGSYQQESISSDSSDQ